MTTAHVTEQEDGSVEIRFHYNPWVIEQIKALIPGFGRSYKPEQKMWIVFEPWASEAIRILEEAFDTVKIERNPGRQSAKINSTSSIGQAYTELHLLESAPPELIKGAYRILAKLNHPDHGGSSAAMRQINAAFERIQDAGRMSRAGSRSW